MTTREIEIYMARLYTDAGLRDEFVANPIAQLKISGLSEESIQVLKDMDMQGLLLAGKSYQHKRDFRKGRSLWRRLKKLLKLG